MRIRTIKPEWLDDELMANASDEARVLSVALILMADDHGRGRASIATIASGAWRYQMERNDGAQAGEVLAKASRALRELLDIGFVRVYEVSKQRYYELPNWTRHQKVDKPGQPRVPAPESQENAAIHETSPTSSRETRESLAPDQDQDLRSGPRPGAEPTPTREHPVSAFDRAARGPAQAAPDSLSRRDVRRAFSDIRVDRRIGSWCPMGHRDNERLDALAEWANEEGRDRATRLSALTDAIRGFLADTSARVVEAKYGLAFLTDPGAYMESWRKANPVRQAVAVDTPRGRLIAERERLRPLRGRPGTPLDEAEAIDRRWDEIQQELKAL